MKDIILKYNYKMHLNLFYISSICILITLIYILCYHIFEWEFYIPFSYCGFHDFLRLYCPGCGGTRAINELLSLHIKSSFLANPIVIYIAAVGMYYYISAFYTFIIKKDGKIHYKLSTHLLWIALGIVVGFFVLRNVLLLFWNIDYLGDFIF